MTSSQVETRTGLVRVRVTFNSNVGWNLSEVQAAFEGVAGLLYVGGAIAAADEASEAIKSGYFAKEVNGLAWSTVDSTPVARVSYNSPLEVVLAISSGAVSATAIGTALITLAHKFDELRTQFASNRLHRSALHLLIQELEEREVSTGDLRSFDRVEDMLNAASLSAFRLDSIAIEPDDAA